jgi:hypothetical protein
MLESLYQFSKIIREIVKIDETNKKLKIMIFPFPLYLEFRISNPDTLEKVVDRFSLG